MKKKHFKKLLKSVQEMKDIEKKEMEKSIPKGLYCYNENGRCPWLEHRPEHHGQEDGYCKYLGKGDYEINREVKEATVTYTNKAGKRVTEIEIYGPDNPCAFSLLWDMCKECGIDNEIDEEEWN